MGHLFVLFQGFYGGILASQFGLSEQCMYLAVAYAVQQRGLHAPVRLGHQMVRVLLAGGNGALAQGAQHGIAARCGQRFKLCLNELFPDAPRHG